MRDMRGVNRAHGQVVAAKDKKIGEMTDYIKHLKENNDKLSAELSQYQRTRPKEIKEILKEIVHCPEGEEQLLTFIAIESQKQIDKDIRVNKLIVPATAMMKSISSYSHDTFLENRSSCWLTRITAKIGQLSHQNKVRGAGNETSLRQHIETRAASIVANLYSLVNNKFTWDFGLGFQTLTRMFSPSANLADCANAVVPGGVDYRQMAIKLGKAGREYRADVCSRIKRMFTGQFLTFDYDNASSGYLGKKNSRSKATMITHIASVICNFCAVASKMDEGELNVQLIKELAPGSASWKPEKEVEKSLILEVTESEQKHLFDVAKLYAEDGKLLYENNKAEIKRAIEEARSVLDINDDGTVNNNIAAGVDERERERREQLDIEVELFTEHVERNKQGSTHERIHSLDVGDDGELYRMSFETWFQFKECPMCQMRYDIKKQVCKTCQNADATEFKDFNKSVKLPSTSCYRNQYECQRPRLDTRFENRQTKNKTVPNLSTPASKTITTEIVLTEYGQRVSRTTVEQHNPDDDDAMDEDTNGQVMTYIDLPCECMNPNIAANKIAAIELCKKYGDVKGPNNENGTRYFCVVQADAGAFAPITKSTSEGVIQLIGGWHELQCYLKIVMAMVYPLITDFYSKNLTRGDSDGFRNLLHKGLDFHKCMQALKEISKTINAVYWGEFVSEKSNYSLNQQTAEVFLKEFLYEKSKSDEQQKMYIDTFILGLLPSLFAFEHSLRTNNPEMRSAVRKFMLPYVFARGRFVYAKRILSEMIMLDHCAPKRVKKALEKHSFSYNKDSFDSLIESVDKTKKALARGEGFEAWTQSDVLHANSNGVQQMMNNQAGVKLTKDDGPQSKRLPNKDADMVNSIALLSTNSAIMPAQGNSIEYVDFQGISGTCRGGDISAERIYKVINNELVIRGKDLINETLDKVRKGESLANIKGTNDVFAIYAAETNANVENENE